MTPANRAEEFVFLLARHERPLGAYVMTMVPHAQDADDILQEAKVIMWRNFARFESGTNFGAWARKIAFHQVLAFRKRKHRDRLDFSQEFLKVVADEVESQRGSPRTARADVARLRRETPRGPSRDAAPALSRRRFRSMKWRRASGAPLPRSTACSAACGMCCMIA